jgi:hypothetical protein
LTSPETPVDLPNTLAVAFKHQIGSIFCNLYTM